MSAKKIFAFGCLGMFLAAVIAIVLLTVYWRNIATSFAEQRVEQTLVALEFPPEEREALMRPVRKLTQKLRDQEIDLNEAEVVAIAVESSKAAPAIAIRAFEHSQLKEKIPEDERELAHKTCTRFTQAIIEEKITRQILDELKAIAVTNAEFQGETKETLKKELSLEEIRKCLTIMQDAANKAGIEDKVFDIDYEGLLDEAIQKGLEKAKSEDPNQATLPATPAQNPQTQDDDVF